MSDAPERQEYRISTAIDPEDLARSFHEAYERLAPDHGYSTREESRLPWADVPEPNRSLMIAVCEEIGPLFRSTVHECCVERDALAARLNSILDAIGDPDELRWHRWHCDDTGNGDDLRDLLVRIADAADPDKSEHGNLRPLTAEDEAIIEDVRRSVQPRPGVSTMDLTEDRLCPEVPVPTEPTADPDRSTE